MRTQRTRPTAKQHAAQKRARRVEVAPVVERWADVPRNQVLCMDALDMVKRMPSESVRCIITSIPYYGLRDYGVEGQMGLEETPELFIAAQTQLFAELRRVLRKDGTLWLNIGDSYSASGGNYKNGSQGSNSQIGKKAFQGLPSAGRQSRAQLPPKNLMGMPWRVALALQADGWILRSDIIWAKPNPMPESVKDRPTKSHEYIFLLTKSERYYYDHEAIKEKAVNGDPNQPRGSKGVLGQQNAGNRKVFRGGGKYTGDHYLDNSTVVPNAVQGNDNQPVEWRNRRTVWNIATEGTPFAHFATFPTELIRPMILAGSQPGDVVYDPFMGSFTTALVARELGRDYCGSELNPEYVAIGNARLSKPYVLSLERAIVDNATAAGESAPRQAALFGEAGV